jgi:hypothetical protein
VVVQAERHALAGLERTFVGWEQRRYGRNDLLIWEKETDSGENLGDVAGS